MPAPSIPRFNGQIKTPWRGGYTDPSQLTQFSRECIAEMEGCVFKLFWKNESLMPFQFIRPFSMVPVTSWKLYDGPDEDANEVVNLTSQIALLNYFATNVVGGGAIQYVTYLGAPLDDPLEAGTYYMRIVSGGITYYWEPILITCLTTGGNYLPADPFAEGLYSVDNNPGAAFRVAHDYARLLKGTWNAPGDPTDPTWQHNGARVANLLTGDLLTYAAGVWVPSTPATSGGWYDQQAGGFYFYLAGWYIGPPHVTVDGSGVCWDSTEDVPVEIDAARFGCANSHSFIEFTLGSVLNGELTVGGIEYDADGDYSQTSYLSYAGGITLRPTNAFSGCITAVEATCEATIANCFYRLDWGNCGNIGNTYLAGGYTNSMHFDSRTYPVRPEVSTTVESKQRPDGSLVNLTRRRETTWEIQVGLVPWCVADALAEVPLYDHVELRPVGGGADILSRVQVTVDNPPEFVECFKLVTIRFQIDPASVACCDDFSPPCAESCVDANGLQGDPTPTLGHIYLSDDTSQYGTWNGTIFDDKLPCASGLANILDFVDEFDYTVYFDLNVLAWIPVAVVADVTVTLVEDGCTINILAVIPVGYAAILQYLNADDEWVDDDTYDLSEPEWADNDVQRETPVEENASKTLRLKVYVDGKGLDGKAVNNRCIFGYSEEFTYACA